MPGRSGAARGGLSRGCGQSSGDSAGQEWSPKVEKEAWKAVSLGPGGHSCHKEGPGMSLLIPCVLLEHFNTCRDQRCLGKVIGLTVATRLAGRLGLHGAEFLEFLILLPPSALAADGNISLYSAFPASPDAWFLSKCGEGGMVARGLGVSTCTQAPRASPQG